MKNIVPVVIILVILLVGGYFLMKSKGPAPKANNAMVASQSNPVGSAFTSIQDALSRSLTLQCDFKNEQGVQTTTYIKGGAVRVVMAQAADQKQPNNVILKDKKMYMWNDATKTGFTYTMTEPSVTVTAPTGTGAASGQGSSNDKQASVLASIEKYKNACKAGTVADSFFQIPADVNFQDMNAFTQQMMKQIPSQAIPTQATGGQNSGDY